MSLSTTHRAVFRSAPPARARAAHHAGARRWCLPFLMLLLAVWPCRAEDELPDRGSAADVLQNLATFVDWPPAAYDGPLAPFIIGVLGDEAACRAIEERISGAFVGKRAVVVRPVNDDAGASGCHLLFATGVDAPRLDRVRTGLRGRPVLTVGEGTAFVRAGGMVGLERRGTGTVLYLNVRPLREAGLSASSKLLEIAQVIDVPETSP